MKPAGQANPLERALLEVVGYAVTSARTLLDETPTYGPLRLLETAKRTIEAMQIARIGPEEAHNLQTKIDAAAASLIRGEDAFRLHVDALVTDTLRLVCS